MKITFIGSSHGVPSAERYCSCAMVEVNSAIYLIDAGAPVIDELLRLGRDVHNLRAVFTTHAHSDHTNGILCLADLMNWYFRDAAADFYLTEPTLGPAFTQLIEATLGGKLDTQRIRFHTVDADFVYQDENIRVSLIPTQHMVGRPSYAILVEGEGKRVLFSGDLSGHLAKNDVPAIITEEALDVFVCELAHFGLDALTPWLDKCLARSVYINHLAPLSKFEELRALQGKYPFPIQAVADRDEIDL